MVKRIKRARISFLSLVPKGATRLPGLYKSKDNILEWSPLCKAPDDFEEKGELTILVYASEHADDQGHIADSRVISDMAHTFMEEGAKVDIRHNRKELKKDSAYVAESFIVQRGDPRFEGLKDTSGKVVDATDGWGVVMQINDPELRKAYREGDWDGVSLYSYPGDYTIDDDSDAVEKALEEFQRRLHKSEELDMDEKQLVELLKANNKDLVETLAAALTKEPKAEPKTEPKTEPKKIEAVALEYKGDPTDVEALTKFQEELELTELRKGYDFTKPEEVKEYIAKVEELSKNKKTKEDNNDSDADATLKAQILELEKELKSNKKASNNPEGGGDKTPQIAGLSKEDSKAWAAGKRIAAISNKKRGYTS